MTDTFRKEYTPVSDAQKAQVLDIKTQAEKIELIFNAALANGYDPRLIAIAKTHLETAIMFAVKAVTGGEVKK